MQNVPYSETYERGHWSWPVVGRHARHHYRGIFPPAHVRRQVAYVAMSTHEAAKILTEHNRWRRGQSPYDQSPSSPHSPQIIGEAIDAAIHFIHSRESALGHKAKT